MLTGAEVLNINDLMRTLPQRFLASGMNTNTLRTNALLRKDEWILLDERLVYTFNEVLNGVADLRARNLTHDVGGLGTLISQYEKVSDMDEANVHMSGAVNGIRDRVDFTMVGVPVPLIFKDFDINIRHLEASRRLGQTIDTTQQEVSARKVAEKLEDILFNGNTMVVDGNPVYGYTTHPNRNTISTSADWGTGTNIYPSIMAMVGAMVSDRCYGPWVLYVNPEQWAQAIAITDTTRQKSELQVVLDSIPRLEDIKLSDSLAPGNAVMVQMSRDVVDLALAQDVVNVEWESQGGMVQHFRVMMAAIPRVKSDANGRCGIVHHSGI